jgi:ribonuclease HI
LTNRQLLKIKNNTTLSFNKYLLTQFTKTPKIVKIKAHSGIKQNENVDHIAKEALELKPQQLPFTQDFLDSRPI